MRLSRPLFVVAAILGSGRGQVAIELASNASASVALAYDRDRDRLILGTAGPTLEWSGGQWQRGPTSPAAATDGVWHAGDHACWFATAEPQPRLLRNDGFAITDFGPMPPEAQGLAYDGVRNELLTVVRGPTLEMHAWNGTAWSPRPASVEPVGALFLPMAFDEARGVLVVQVQATGAVETHEWNGSGWRLAQTQSTRTGALGYDPVNRRVIAVDRSTLAWDGTNWTTVASSARQTLRGAPRLATDTRRGVVWHLTTEPTSTTPQITGFDGTAWSREAPTPNRPFVSLDSFAFDRGRGAVLKLGRTGFFAFDGFGWSTLDMTGGPSLVNSVLVAYDEPRAEAIVHESVAPGFTWRWNGTWTRLTATTPSPRLLASTAYDSARGRAILLGGVVSGSNFRNEHWEWDGTTWTQVFSSAPDMVAAVLGYDPLRRRLVALIAGSTWEYDGTSWTRVATGGPPAALTRLEWHPPSQALVGLLLGRLQRWDGSTWTQIGQVQGQGQVVADPRRDAAYVVGNAATTLITSAPPAAFDFGSGCGGAAMPVLRPFGRPRIGEAEFRVDHRGRTGGQLVLLVVGASPGAAPIGSGCTLLVPTPAALVPAVTDAGGFASVPLPVPADPRLVTTALVVQTAALEPSTPTGIVFSAGLRLVVGF